MPNYSQDGLKINVLSSYKNCQWLSWVTPIFCYFKLIPFNVPKKSENFHWTKKNTRSADLLETTTNFVQSAQPFNIPGTTMSCSLGVATELHGVKRIWCYCWRDVTNSQLALLNRHKFTGWTKAKEHKWHSFPNIFLLFGDSFALDGAFSFVQVRHSFRRRESRWRGVFTSVLIAYPARDFFICRVCPLRLRMTMLNRNHVAGEFFPLFVLLCK
jgi:hypothetical protein